MTTAAQLVAEALSEVGYTEDPPGSNCNRFAREAGLKDCTFWCGAYTSALLIRLHVAVPPGVLTLSTRANLAAWKKAGQWVEPADIKAGDILFFHLTGRNGSDHSIPDHTGFATADRAAESVEGNTSASDHGSQDNGGGVFVKHRPLAVVIGAGRPAYATQEEDVSDIERMVLSKPGDASLWFAFRDRQTGKLLDGKYSIATPAEADQQINNELARRRVYNKQATRDDIRQEIAGSKLDRLTPLGPLSP